MRGVFVRGKIFKINGLFTYFLVFVKQAENIVPRIFIYNLDNHYGVEVGRDCGGDN